MPIDRILEANLRALPLSERIVYLVASCKENVEAGYFACKGLLTIVSGLGDQMDAYDRSRLEGLLREVLDDLVEKRTTN